MTLHPAPAPAPAPTPFPLPPPPLELQYARQPPGSLASCQYRGDGGVIITIPPMLHRRMVKVALAIVCLSIVSGLVLFILALAVIPFRWAGIVEFLGIVLTLPALAGLVVTLWMGMRWTIIEAGPEGLRLELRGLLFTRRWFVERGRIARLRSFVSIWVIGRSGLPLRRIDATDRTEDKWVMEILTRALASPPPIPPALPPARMQKTA
jgi:hypothetical protein